MDLPEKILLGELPVDPEVDQVAGDRQPGRHPEGIIRVGDFPLQPGEEAERHPVLEFLDLPVGIVLPGDLAEPAVDPSADNRRGPVEVHLRRPA